MTSNNSPHIKALIVDDQQSVVDLLSLVMESIGVEAIKAYDGEMGYTKFIETNPNIVFTDILMPKMNGIILLKKIKTQKPNLPVIIFTGYSHFKSMLQDQKLAPDNFLMKPVDTKQIIEIMRGYFPALQK
jgi:YesN/AraC family two-component response regulator